MIIKPFVWGRSPVPSMPDDIMTRPSYVILPPYERSSSCMGFIEQEALTPALAAEGRQRRRKVAALRRWRTGR